MLYIQQLEKSLAKGSIIISANFCTLIDKQRSAREASLNFQEDNEDNTFTFHEVIGFRFQEISSDDGTVINPKFTLEASNTAQHEPQLLGELHMTNQSMQLQKYNVIFSWIEAIDHWGVKCGTDDNSLYIILDLNISNLS